MSTQRTPLKNQGGKYLMNDGQVEYWGTPPSSSETYIKNFLSPTAWLDASETSLITKDDNNLVSLVLDKSGNNNDFTPSNASFKPLFVNNVQNGLSGIQFGSSNSTNLITPAFLNQGNEHITMFIVRKPNSGVTTPNIEVDLSNTGYYSYVFNNWKSVQSYSNSTQGVLIPSLYMSNIGKDTTYNNTALIETTRFGYGKRTFGIDYRILTRPETGQHTMGGSLTIGSNTPSGSGIRSTVLEVICFSRYLSDDEVAYVLRYLNKKWNITTPEVSSPDGRLHFLNSQVVFVGDSLTTGWGTGVGQGYVFNFPNQVMEMVGSGFYTNLGNAGATTVGIQTNVNNHALPLLSGKFERNVAVVWAGFNDLFHTSDSASTISTRLVNLCNSLKNAGYKVAVSTITTTTSTSPAPQANFETRRTELNNYIKTNWASFANALIDLTTQPLLSDANASDNTLYYDPDKIHLKDTGYKLVADIARPVITSLLN